MTARAQPPSPVPGSRTGSSADGKRSDALGGCSIGRIKGWCSMLIGTVIAAGAVGHFAASPSSKATGRRGPRCGAATSDRPHQHVGLSR